MRLPRPRLTVRRLMILVALTGLLMGGLAFIQRRREQARATAAYHHDEYLRVFLTVHVPALTGSALRKQLSLVDYHAARRDRWLEAAVHPWLPFEADPPAPE